MEPKRRESWKHYNFSLTSYGDRYGRTPTPTGPPYQVDYVQIIYVGRQRHKGAYHPHVLIQGQILTTDQAVISGFLGRFKTSVAKICKSPESSSGVHLRSENPFGQSWEYGTDFCVTTNSVILPVDKAGKQNEAVWQLYRSLAEEFGFASTRPSVDILHKFMLFINGSWTQESYEFTERFYGK
jgi:hypothetical protein